MAADTVEADTEKAPAKKQAGGKKFSRRELIWGVIISAIILPICLLWIYPFIWVLASSFKSNSEIFSSLNLFTPVVRLDNYVRAWSEANMGQYLFNTIFIAFFSIVISVISNALMGYVLGRYAFAGKKIVIGLFAAGIFLPEGYTIIPIYDLIDFLQLNDSLWGVTLAESGGINAMMVLLFAGYFNQLPKELGEAAHVDGAGFLRVFAQIYLPLAKPVIATGIILQFMHSWNDFLLPLVLTLTRPELRTLSVGIYSLTDQYFNDWGLITAASTIALVPIIVVFLFLQRYFIESFSGAVKG